MVIQCNGGMFYDGMVSRPGDPYMGFPGLLTAGVTCMCVCVCVCERERITYAYIQALDLETA